MSTASNKSPTALIFDSGVGGLSVYQEIRNLLPSLKYIYMFDNEAYPYGELEHDVLIDRVNKLSKDIVNRHQIDIVVIACNTASTIVLPSLRESLSIPVVGVVPAIKPASVIANKGVGLIATPATVRREYTHSLIRKYLADKKVELLGSTKLVDMAEQKLRGRAVDLNQLDNLLSGLKGKIDVAVLGCTHFPLIKEEISRVLGGEVILVDSGKAIANRVGTLLDINEKGTAVASSTLNIAYCSARPYGERELNKTFSRLGFKAIEMLPILDV